MPRQKVKAKIRYAKDVAFDFLFIGVMGRSRIFGKIWSSTPQIRFTVDTNLRF
jgi:hypothetical protein